MGFDPEVLRAPPGERDDIPLLVRFIKNNEITHEIPTFMG